MGRGQRRGTGRTQAATGAVPEARASRPKLPRDQYLPRAEAAERLLQEREREIGFEAKAGPHPESGLLEQVRERVGSEGGGVSFYSGEGLKLACLRALTTLPLAVEDVVLGISSSEVFDWSEDEIREAVVELLARHHYVSEIDFLGSDPPRHLLPPQLLEDALAAREPQKARRRSSALAS